MVLFFKVVKKDLGGYFVFQCSIPFGIYRVIISIVIFMGILHGAELLEAVKHSKAILGP